MIVKLFDIENGVVKPTEHCFVIKFLKDIMETYPDEYLIIYAYLFYMTCPNNDINPFFNLPESEKEDIILEQINAEFSTEDSLILDAVKMCEKLYETPTSRAYNGIKIALDNMATFMATEKPTSGRDGSASALLRIAERFDQVRQSFKGVYNDLKDEQKSHVSGGIGLSYDQE
jgi:hypothetical protein